MPTNKQNWRELLRHCLLINLAATVVAIAFNATTSGLQTIFSPQWIVSSFVYSNCIGTLISFVIFYFAPRWNKNSAVIRLSKVSLSIFVATFIGVTIAGLILSIIFPPLAKQGLIPSWQIFVFSLGIAFTFGFGVYFYEVSQAKLREKELDEEKAKTLATEAQLASLESRIHPHFLFNTLNSIAALIREEPILAEKMVEKLSALLRYSLDANAQNLVPFEQELEITKKYLDIEKVRFEERLSYKIEADEKFAKVKLPPFSLQTLVENSIKHVASKRSDKTEIVVSAKENAESLEIEVSDNGNGFSSDKIKIGHGLDSLQKRLQTIFQESACLEIVENGKVRLKIPKEN